ncbi:uncharacterized protein DSM5745_08375 [Aspergillus mulundensis]|uniref:Uncharacterized protein n=1 Tax=Aspergillus mulundensis TaxID=1810919 RepID=A0A3D8RAG6_9EURO|nr:hypothetical protein DSM5745_08375 [Aspergillus mulundensis]RDW70864.1 hypothetical protein DSM5745_08375 [Aspergillus mulundensis]
MHPTTTPPPSTINDLLLISQLSISSHLVSSHASLLQQKLAAAQRSQHLAGLRLQLRTTLAEGKRRRKTTSMMDEIELQLCLSIDPTPARDPTATDENQKPKQTTPLVKHKPQLQILGAKRPADSLEYDGDVDKEAQTSALHLAHSLNPAYKDEDRVERKDKIDHDADLNPDLARPGPFHLPPRKKVRTSFSFTTPESTSPCQAMAGDDPDPDPSPSPNTIHNTTPASESFSSQPYFAHPASMPQPQASSPFPQFSERPGPEAGAGAYMPALLDSLLTEVHPHSELGSGTRQSHYFEIYEDPDDMDIDGVGYFDLDAVVCMSPDEDKENENTQERGSQGSQGQNQNQNQNQNQSQNQNQNQNQNRESHTRQEQQGQR